MANKGSDRGSASQSGGSHRQERQQEPQSSTGGSKSESWSGHRTVSSSSSRSGRSQPESRTKRVASLLVLDILFGTLVLFLLYVYIGFRVPSLRANNWMGLRDDGGSAGHLINTLFTMALAVITREISHPVAQLAQQAFDLISAPIDWQADQDHSRL